MQITTFLILPLVFVIFFTGFTPLSFSSEESDARENIEAGCRDGHILVVRFAYRDYVCVTHDTAKRWEDLGLAKIFHDFTPAKKEIEPNTLQPELESPLIAQKKIVSMKTTDSKCRDGYYLVFRFMYHDTLCTSPSTAASWERLGLAEIVNVEESEETILHTDDFSLKDVEIIQKLPKDTPELMSSFNLLESSNFPKIYQIEERIWAVVDYDDHSTSVFIEGDSGIIVIDLSSYKSIKKTMDEFKTISDKELKVIIFTSINPESVYASNMLIDEDYGDVDVVLSDALYDIYTSENELKIKNAITYSSKFSLNVTDVVIDLFSTEAFVSANGTNSHQTYISLPDYDGLLIGDSLFGIFPVILDMEFLEILYNYQSFSDNNK